MAGIIPDGVYPTMLTPYTGDNKVDYDAVEQLIDWYVKKGVSGIFAVCQSSEMFYLDADERYDLLKFIMSVVPEGISVVASGHVSADVDTAVYQAQKFVDLGIDGYVFISNRLAEKEESDDVLLRNVDYFMDAIPNVSFGIYECPFPYKRIVTPRVMGELARTGRFSFLKDTCCDPALIKEKLSAVKGTDFKIFNANSATFLETLQMGCSGFSGVMANFHPDLYAWLCDNYSLQPEKAKVISDFLGFFSVAERQVYPINAKYYLQLEGLRIEPYSRVRSMDEFTLSAMREIEQMRDITEYFKSNLLRS